MLPADLGATLESINLDPAIIRAIMSMLDEGADSVSSAEVDRVPAGQFGGSDAAAMFANDAALAHEKFKTALEDMVVGLNGYRENIATYSRNQLGTDELNGAALSRLNSDAVLLSGLQQSSDCLNTPTVAAPSTCAAPTDGDAGADS